MNVRIENDDSSAGREREIERASANANLQHAGAVQGASIVVAIVRRERAVVRAIPRVVQRVARVTLIAVNLQLVVIGLRMDFEMCVLSVAANARSKQRNS